MKRNKLLSLLLALALAFSLAACANNDQPTESSAPPETTLPVESETPSTEPDSSEAVTTRVTVLNGPTGVAPPSCCPTLMPAPRLRITPTTSPPPTTN